MAIVAVPLMAGVAVAFRLNSPVVVDPSAGVVNSTAGFEFETIKVREAIFETLPFESIAFNVNEYEPFAQAVVSKLHCKAVEEFSMHPSASILKLLLL